MKKLVFTSSVLIMVAGVILVIGGVGGIWFTSSEIARENIVTPQDAAIPEAPVRGPLTLKAQTDSMRKHVLRMTDGKTYAEMPRQIPKPDEAGKPVLDKEGKEVMMPNTARDIWVTYTALTTALNLALLSYAFSGMSILIGLIFISISVVFFKVLPGRI